MLPRGRLLLEVAQTSGSNLASAMLKKKQTQKNKRGEDFRLDVAVWLQPHLQQTESKGLNPTNSHLSTWNLFSVLGVSLNPQPANNLLILATVNKRCVWFRVGASQCDFQFVFFSREKKKKCFSVILSFRLPKG